MSRFLDFFRANHFELLIVVVAFALCVVLSWIAKVEFAWSWWCYPFVAVYAVTLAALVFLCALGKKEVLKNLKSMWCYFPWRTVIVACLIAAGCYWCMVVWFGLGAAEAATLITAGVVWFFTFWQALCLIIRVQ
ncbi:hypothetical protein [Halodesulfovibrio aestuarii]|uniref:Transmembrane protein n=1 Tax=Halodesulfovibrio aestuarii TaxID=126333 RepID=A0A8G2F9R0_9BACT|nr:hypothetical protein [Halodesulfovibrio aestuarii]SHI60393.1 hypothetical protein SAMN05660830_00432 [Halodesulfovibrio aestuarii]